MKNYTHIRMIQNDSLETFTETILRHTEEFQGRGFEIEYDFKPLFVRRFFRKKIVYTCMLRAYIVR